MEQSKTEIEEEDSPFFTSTRFISAMSYNDPLKYYKEPLYLKKVYEHFKP